METRVILKELRTENNLSMEELCEKLNENYNLKITKSMVSRWESGQTSPNNTYLSAYAKYFNIDLNYLAGLTDIKRPLKEQKNDDKNESTTFKWVARNVKNMDEEQLKKLQGLMKLAFDELYKNEK